LDNKISLLLGCGGYSYNDIVLCAETQSIVVSFNKHHSNDEYEKIMNFLDNSCKLFDNTITDWNKIVNILKIFHDQFNLIDNKKWDMLYIWFPMHKRCGGYLQLVVDAQLPEDHTSILIHPKI
jgi:hypothetical protein